MEHESTLKLVTNLDRSGIEALLETIRLLAAERGMADIAGRLENVVGKSRMELDALIHDCIRLAHQAPGNRSLVDQLEMAEINLPNLG